MKSTLLAAACFALFAAFTPAPVEAKPKVIIHLGIPHYGYDPGPGYRFRRGYGWYRPIYRDYTPYRLSCRQAAREIRALGYRNITALDCSGRTYVFEASRRGRLYELEVNSRTGSIRRY
jgi:hypothetical protein